jgi:hypothetical protein
MNSTRRLFFVTLLLACCWISPAAQTQNPLPCEVGVRAPAIGFWTWPQDAHVKVYVRVPDFTPPEIPYLVTALQTWDAAHEQSGSGVRFEYQGAALEPMLCVNCLTIMRGKVFDKTKRHATELQAVSIQSNQVITHASIVIDPVLTNLEALTNAMAHELGHSVGLLDCYACRQKSTVMNQFKTINVSNDMNGPTACDLAQVQAAYRELKINPRRAPAALGATVADEGEEPVDDDTPIIPRKP